MTPTNRDTPPARIHLTQNAAVSKEAQSQSSRSRCSPSQVLSCHQAASSLGSSTRASPGSTSRASPQTWSAIHLSHPRATRWITTVTLLSTSCIPGTQLNTLHSLCHNFHNHPARQVLDPHTTDGENGALRGQITVCIGSFSMYLPSTVCQAIF